MTFRWLLVTLVLTLASFGHPQIVSAAAEQSPNVLFIAVDDLNNWISALEGHPQAKTPNIDRLVKRGMLFTNCYCAAPACNPSRVALMTGLRPSTTGVYINPQPFRSAHPDLVTLPQYFRQHGYYALGSGKIYHSSGVYTDPKSWDEYAPGLTKQTFPARFKVKANKNGLEKGHFDWGSISQQSEEMPDYKSVDYVCRQLEKDWEQPFFLACGIFRPHLPWYVPEQYFEQYPLSDIELPLVKEDDLADIPQPGLKMAKPQGDHAAVVKNKQWERAVQGYLASIAFTDAMIGKLLKTFDNSPHRDNTIIVFWTDHGWHLGEKEHWRKFALWEDATQVPLAIIAPGVTEKNQRCNVPVNLVDLYPTLNDLCGLPARDDLDGLSLRPLLENPRTTWERPSLTTHGRNNHALRAQRWRYIHYADGSEELYDHENDPHEWTNLAGDPQYRSVIDGLKQWLPKKNAPDIPTNKKKTGGKKKNKS